MKNLKHPFGWSTDASRYYSSKKREPNETLTQAPTKPQAPVRSIKRWRHIKLQIHTLLSHPKTATLSKTAKSKAKLHKKKEIKTITQTQKKTILTYIILQFTNLPNIITLMKPLKNGCHKSCWRKNQESQARHDRR